ncbi:hypothetical protein [Dysgonomonas sp. 25]|uniref:hypothetical protein n=1 Tax=Dysgonomonas sp. 25 TaxID=2302933 RepID=UPI0013D03470|nr:hypothetical protein [Dysgonomonas sp. 25]NDV69304.1 hypothetical protein [Dysgonomonas sp. 25]
MKRKPLFILISLLSIILILILAFHILDEQDKELDTIAEPDCPLIEFVMPVANVLPPREGRQIFNYHYTDLFSIRAENTIALTYPSKEIPNIDSLFSRILSAKTANHLEQDEWVMLSVKVEDMPLDIAAKLMCFMKKNNISKQWLLDLVDDDFSIIIANDVIDPLPLNQTGYKQYTQSVDYEKLKELEFKEYRFRLVAFDTNFQHEAELVATYQIDRPASFQAEVDKFSVIVADFKAKYQPAMDNIPSDSMRKAIQIGFDKTIPMAHMLRIIDIASQNELLYDCFYERGYLNIYTKCHTEELLSVPYKPNASEAA